LALVVNADTYDIGEHKGPSRELSSNHKPFDVASIANFDFR